jgi:CHAT domain-containing protein
MANPEYGKGPGTKAGNLILSVDPLPATAEEAAQIKSVLGLQSEEMLLEERANKRELKELRSPAILHIATHGYFLQEEEREANAEQRLTRIKSGIIGEGAEEELRGMKLENPLLRSGLLLAGANRGNGDEGILTALELTGLDLWGTKIVVLSACDTGVGEVKNGDGVYGLRRALVLAGSESQMMSLWPVSDAGTRDLMINYYRALKAGEGRSAGLRRVRLEFLKDARRAHPYYWASFIQSGEWANLDGNR